MNSTNILEDFNKKKDFRRTIVMCAGKITTAHPLPLRFCYFS